MDAIHSSGVFGWIEQPHVDFVHPQAGEPSVGGTLAQDSAAVGIPFDCGDGLVPEYEIGEQSAACPGE